MLLSEQGCGELRCRVMRRLRVTPRRAFPSGDCLSIYRARLRSETPRSERDVTFTKWSVTYWHQTWPGLYRPKSAMVVGRKKQETVVCGGSCGLLCGAVA